MNPCTAPLSRPRTARTGRPPTSSGALHQRNALVEANRHLVPPLAHHYWRRCPEPQDDLIQVGLLGLIRAAELYRPSLETPFAAFARPHIRGAILHYLRDTAATVRLPRRQAELQTQLQRLEEQMANRPPAEAQAESCRRLEISPEQWHLLQRHRNLCRPAPLNPELVEQLCTPGLEPAEEGQPSLERVEGLLADLEPRTQEVIKRVVLQGWSYRRAARELGVSAMTVQRCLHRGLETLREQVNGPQNTKPTPRSPIPGRLGPVPSAAPGWPSRHSPPPAAAPAHRART